MGNAVKTFLPEHFLNRELSWLEFNQRVLDEALDPKNPLLERVKFFCITSSNLDEFFEVRVAGLKQQMESDVVERSMDGLTATETFRAITRRVRRMVERAIRLLARATAAGAGETRHPLSRLRRPRAGRTGPGWRNITSRQVRPVLTPLAHRPGASVSATAQQIAEHHRAPGNAAAAARCCGTWRWCRCRACCRGWSGCRARTAGRITFSSATSSAITSPTCFPGTKILGYWHFRVTRNSELYIDEEETANLLKAVENELHNRRKGDAVRLEVEHDCPADIRAGAARHARLTEDDLYIIDGPLNPTRLMAIYEGDHSPELRDPPFVAPVAAALRGTQRLVRRHPRARHPAASSLREFQQRRGFLEQAAADPDVLAIKQTLYRTGGDPRIIGALMNAVRNGKQVTAVVELRARFDEANNIQWARQLEEAGVHVVYGLVGFKIHAKMCAGRAARRATASAATCIWAPAITIPPPRGFTPTSAC